MNAACTPLAAAEGRGKQYREISVRKIRLAKQVRHDFEEIQELAESIEQADSLLQPITVFSVGSDEYELLCGERRVRAYKHLNREHIEAIVTSKPETSADRIAMQLIENIQRSTLKPWEIAEGLQVMVDEKYTHSQIAGRLGVSRQYVVKHLGLIRLPEVVSEVAKEGIIKDIDTLNALRQLFEIAPATCEALCARAIEDKGLNRKVVVEALQNAKKISSDILYDANSEKAATVNSVSKTDDSEHTKALKEAGLNETGLEVGEPTPEPEVETPVNDATKPVEASGEQDLVSSEHASSDNNCRDDDKCDPDSSESSSGKQEAAEGWVQRAAPGKAVIVVEIRVGSGTKRGVLALERLDYCKEHVWVRVANKARTEYARAHVSDIQIVRSEA